MYRGDTAIKVTAVTWMTLVGLFGGAFIVGETLHDPGSWRAIVETACWLGPLVALAALAVLRPASAEPVGRRRSSPVRPTSPRPYTPELHAGTELVEFSPTAELERTLGMVLRNVEANQAST